MHMRKRTFIRVLPSGNR